MLIVRIKNGNNIINIDINSNMNIENEISKKLREKLNYEAKIMNLIQQKVKEAIDTTNKIFEKPMKIYSYKQLSNINKIIFNEPKRNNIINDNDKKRNNSVKYNDFVRDMLNKDLKPDLSDIHNYELLNNSNSYYDYENEIFL